MRIRDLPGEWEQASEKAALKQAFQVRLTLREAAKVAALADMYPGKDPEEIIRDLLAAALHELEAGMPYIPGERVISEDEEGDPIHEDVGPTPRFLALTQKHLERLEREQDSAESA